MSTEEKRIDLEEDETCNAFFSLSYASLVDDSKWTLLARGLNTLFRDLYNDGLLSVKALDVTSYIKDEPFKKLCVDMLFEKSEHVQECMDKHQEEVFGPGGTYEQSIEIQNKTEE